MLAGFSGFNFRSCLAECCMQHARRVQRNVQDFGCLNCLLENLPSLVIDGRMCELGRDSAGEGLSKALRAMGNKATRVSRVHLHEYSPHRHLIAPTSRWPTGWRAPLALSERHAAYLSWVASRRVASCSSSTSTSFGGMCTYRTTEPRIKQFLTESCTNRNRARHDANGLVSGGRGMLVGRPRGSPCAGTAPHSRHGRC